MVGPLARRTIAPMWNPDVYLAHADHRGRPFFDLLSRVGAEKPRRVVDLGCGPGNLTVTLAQRWPDAVIEAWDSSPEMVDAARERGVDAHVGDVRTWTPGPDTDVVVTNATCSGCPNMPSCWSGGPVRWSRDHGLRCRCRGTSTRRRIGPCASWPVATSGQSRCGTFRFVRGRLLTRRDMPSFSPTRAAPSTHGRPHISTT